MLLLFSLKAGRGRSRGRVLLLCSAGGMCGVASVAG